MLQAPGDVVVLYDQSAGCFAASSISLRIVARGPSPDQAIAALHQLLMAQDRVDREAADQKDMG